MVRVPDVRPLNWCNAALRGRAGSRDDPACAEKRRSAVRTLKSLGHSPLLSLAEPRHMHDSMHLNAPTLKPLSSLVRSTSSYTCALHTWIHSDRLLGHDLDFALGRCQAGPASQTCLEKYHLPQPFHILLVRLYIRPHFLLPRLHFVYILINT